jgi:phosphotransferase system  glucose/maltose/N-acetylglucosamine-specific IIC component
MLNGIGSLQNWVLFLLGVASFIVQIVALVDCARGRPAWFVAAGKMTKKRWTIILAVAVAIGFVSFNGNALGFLNIIAFVAGAVYLVDVRPALRRVSGAPGSGSGPAGPW